MPGIKVTRFDALKGTPTILLCGEAWVEMLRTNTVDENSLPFHDDDQTVTVLSPEGAAQAFISYIKWGKELWIKCSYTAPESRKKGMHKALFEELKVVAKELGCFYISGGTHITNETMKIVYRKQGMVPVSENWSYKLS